MSTLLLWVVAMAVVVLGVALTNSSSTLAIPVCIAGLALLMWAVWRSPFAHPGGDAGDGGGDGGGGGD